MGLAQHWPLPQHSVPAGQHAGKPGSGARGASPAGHASQAPDTRSIQRAWAENAYKFDSNFLQIALQSDYLHGRLQPRLVALFDVSGIFVFQPTATFRLTDNILLTGTYIAIEGSRKASFGIFRIHDQAQLRVTYQLN